MGKAAEAEPASLLHALSSVQLQIQQLQETVTRLKFVPQVVQPAVHHQAREGNRAAVVCPTTSSEIILTEIGSPVTAARASRSPSPHSGMYQSPLSPEEASCVALATNVLRRSASLPGQSRSGLSPQSSVHCSSPMSRSPPTKLEGTSHQRTSAEGDGRSTGWPLQGR